LICVAKLACSNVRSTDHQLAHQINRLTDQSIAHEIKTSRHQPVPSCRPTDIASGDAAHPTAKTPENVRKAA